jgi:hypothetical protein
LKLPPKVRIKGRVSYAVLWSDCVDGNPDNRGLCDFDKKQITILRGLSARVTLETFIHEIFHALEFEHQIEIKHKSIHKLEGAVLQLLKLNGWLND